MTPPNNDRLEATLKQLSIMYRALADLNRERSNYSEAWYKLLLEGPLEEIRRLEGEAAELSGRTEGEQSSADIWLRVRGEGIEWPEAPASVLTNVLDTLRKGLQSITELFATGELASRPTRSVIDACDLQLVALRPGSLFIGVQLPSLPESQEQIDRRDVTPAARALSTYLMAAAWTASDQGEEDLKNQIGDPNLCRLTMMQIKRLLPRPRGRVESIEITGRALKTGQSIVLKREAHDRVDRVITSTSSTNLETLETFVGDLREIDLDNRIFTLRNIENQNELTQLSCEYDSDLNQTAFDAIDRRIEVTGQRLVLGPRRSAQRLKVLRLVVFDQDRDQVDQAP